MPEYLREPPATFLGQPRQEDGPETWVYEFLQSDFLCDPDEGNPADIWVRFSHLHDNPVRPYLVSFRGQGEGSVDEVTTYDLSMRILYDDYAPRVVAQLKKRAKVLKLVLATAGSELRLVKSTLEACEGIAAPASEVPTLWDRLLDPV